MAGLLVLRGLPEIVVVGLITRRSQVQITATATKAGVSTFGPSSRANPKVIAADSSLEERNDFTIRKETLWASETASDSEVNKIEVEMIRKCESNNPSVGDSRWPKA